MLSACESAGSPGRGEGLLGLSCAFLQAGAASVTASVWPVDDAASAELMERVYRHAEAGLAFGDALGRAQAELVAHCRSEHLPQFHPFFWAAFVHYGVD